MTGRSSALALAALCACGSAQQFRARVLDEAGRPLPGTVVYEESFVPGDTVRHVDFAFAVAGEDGWAPPRGEPPATLHAARRSCSLLAVLVPGRLPQVSMQRAPCPSSAGPVEREIRLPDAAEGVASDFRYIGFPFPQEPALRERARSADSAPLRAALRRAALLLEAREASLGAGMLGALDALERAR